MKIISRNILTYLLTYLRKKNKKITIEGHTTQLIYNKEDWLKFKHILSFEGTNPNRLFWELVEVVIAQFDQKEHTLDKYLSESDVIKPNIDAESLKVLKYLQTLPLEIQKEYEEKFMQNYTYIKALTQGEKELDNYPFLWRKYH